MWFSSMYYKKRYYFAPKKTVPFDKQLVVFLKNLKIKGKTNVLPLIKFTSYQVL